MEEKLHGRPQTYTDYLTPATSIPDEPHTLDAASLASDLLGAELRRERSRELTQDLAALTTGIPSLDGDFKEVEHYLFPFLVEDRYEDGSKMLKVEFRIVSAAEHLELLEISEGKSASEKIKIYKEFFARKDAEREIFVKNELAHVQKGTLSKYHVKLLEK